MGRNYAENSLKKFLKRKIKITMGVVVSFLITGAVAFAEELINNANYIVNLNGNNITITAKLYQHENTITTDKNLYINSFFNGSTSNSYVNNINNGFNILKNINNGEENILNLSGTTYENGLKLSESERIKEEIAEDITKPNSEVKGNIYVNNSLKEISTQCFLSNDSNLKNEYTDIILINKGIIRNNDIDSNTEIKSHGQYIRGKENLSVYNYGKISVKTANGSFGQSSGQCIIGANSTAYNYGVIEASYGQYGRMSSLNNFNNTRIYNYGFLIGRDGQYLHKTFSTPTGENIAYAENNGVIIAVEGQTLQSENAKMINNGLIVSKNSGQKITTANNVEMGIKNSEVHNYGLIETFGGAGQEIYGTLAKVENSTAYNYGILSTNEERYITNGAKQEMGGQNVHDDGNIVNYGIIKSLTNGGQILFATADSDSKKMSAVNNGLINSKNYAMRINYLNKVNSFNAEAVNNGIVITDGEKAFSDDNDVNENVKDKKITANNGIALKRTNNELELHSQTFSNGENINNNTYNLTENKTITEIENDSSITVANQKNNIFVNNLDKDSNVTLTVDKDTLDNKHITAVLGKESKSDTAVKSTGDLTLNNSTIIGYFEKDGTLLNVDGDLILSGNSVINAIAGNEYTGYKGNALNNAVAVKLSDNGTLTIGENSKVLGAVKGNGTLVYENIDDEFYSNTQEVDSAVIKTTAGKTTDITLANLTLKDSGTGVNNAGKLIIDNQSDKKLEGKEVSTTITLANNINIENGIDGSSSANGIELILGDGQTSSDNTISVDSITLGTESDILTINNALKEVGVIDGKDGDDIVNLKNLTGTYDTFDYQLKNIETLDLNNQTWKIGTKADISFDNGITKAGEKTTIQNGTLMGELKGTVKDGADFVNNEAVNKVIGNSTFGDNAKFQIGIGKDMKLVAGGEYDITDTTVENLDKNVGADKITASAIFTKATEQGKDIRVKSAKEMNIDERYSGIYEEMLKNASSNSEILNVLNSTDVSSIANAINEKGALGDTLATTGYKITRDISNSFMSAVNEWGKKANKGEWLANAKYINSDVEYDGANKVKGYDSDIKSMVGMIEYGVSDNTSLGIALGGGDTEIDVKDAGTLKGDNYYIGAYAKHSVNGFDLTGNLGYTISDLEVNGKGSADSSAITLGGYIKRDIALTETVRLEPNLSFTYDYIMQDNAEGNGVKVDNKDVHVFEAGAGMNIVKGFNFEKGVLELEAGVKYSMADVNRNEETVISVYGIDDINLGNPEVDKTRGTAHVGFDYEHETGFGVNGKYETMWSASGDDSRITAGISYRF